MKHRIYADPPSVQTTPDLFTFSERQRVRSLPLLARRLAHRLGIPAPTALMVAEAAGFAFPSEAGR